MPYCIMKRKPFSFKTLVEGPSASKNAGDWSVIIYDVLKSEDSNEIIHDVQKIITHERYDYFSYDAGT